MNPSATAITTNLTADNPPRQRRIALAALRRRRLLYLFPGQAPQHVVLYFVGDLAKLGLAVVPQDIPLLQTADPQSFAAMIQIARELTGADKQHYKPLHADFTHTVPSMNDADLYGTALLHYLSVAFGGNWRPEGIRGIVEPLKARTMQLVRIARNEDISSIAHDIVQSGQPFSDEDQVDMWALSPFVTEELPVSIKENLAFLVAYRIGGHEWTSQLRTTTDVLRVASELSGGDRSLTQNTRFRLSRASRRLVVATLEDVLSRGDFDRHLSDIQRHVERWKRLLHCLHVQEYPQARRVNQVRQLVHNSGLPDTPVFPYSREYQLFELQEMGDIEGLISELEKDPGDFSRRLHAVIRKNPQQRERIVEAFRSQAPRVSARVLVQMWNFFHTRGDRELPYRVVLPKNGWPKFIRNTLSSEDDYRDIIAAIEAGLAGRHRDLQVKVKNLEELQRLTMHLGVRTASTSTRSVGRGSRMHFGDRNFVRLFLLWSNGDERAIDLDLSAYFLGEDYSERGHVSYTKLRHPELGAYHSGDITTAPEPAAEFIDIYADRALAAGVRYVVVMAYSYSRVPFEKIPDNSIGVMTRDDAHTGEHLEPCEIMLKLDLASPSTAMTPAVIDLRTRELIYTDWTVRVNTEIPNNVENSASTLTLMMQNLAMSRHMSISTFLELTGARVDAPGNSPTGIDFDPTHTEAVLKLFDC